MFEKGENEQWKLSLLRIRTKQRRTIPVFSSEAAQAMKPEPWIRWLTFEVTAGTKVFLAGSILILVYNMNFGLFSFQRWLWRLLVTATKSPRRGTASCWPRYLRSAVYPSLHCLRWALNTPPKGLSVAKAKAWRTGMVWKSQSCVLVAHLNGKRRALAWWEFLV